MVYFDYAWQHPTPEQVIAAGGTGILRYISRDRSKDLSANERDLFLSYGLDIGVVWEAGTGDALNGAGQGALDGAQMRARLDQLDAPSWVSAMWAVDQNVSPGDYPALDAYGQAFAAQQGGRPTGVYAESQYIEHAQQAGIVHAGWFAGATSWSGGYITPDAHLIQRVYSPIPGTDLNDVQIMPFGTWLHPIGDTVATPEEIAAAVWNYASPGASDGSYVGAPMFIFVTDTRRAMDTLPAGVWNYNLTGRFGLPDAPAQVYAVDARVAAGSAYEAATQAVSMLADQAKTLQEILDKIPSGEGGISADDSELHAQVSAALTATQIALTKVLGSANETLDSAKHALVPPTA